MSVVARVTRNRARFTVGGTGPPGRRRMLGAAGIHLPVSGGYSTGLLGSLSIDPVIVTRRGPTTEPTGEQRELLHVAQVLAWLEPDRLSGRDADLRSGPGVAADPLFARFDLENAEAAQFDPLAA